MSDGLQHNLLVATLRQLDQRLDQFHVDLQQGIQAHRHHLVGDLHARLHQICVVLLEGGQHNPNDDLPTGLQ